MMPGLGGPACAIASDVPPKSSATIARLFMVLIYTSGCLRRTHPDMHENALSRSSVPGEQKKRAVRCDGPEVPSEQLWPRPSSGGLWGLGTDGPGPGAAICG